MAGLAELEGCVAAVTGGASGIAEELLARGVQVVIADIETARLEATVARSMPSAS